MPKRNTKELILDAALKLFSDRGYDGVGVRDIAKEVGIRESALYKHYRSKQDIFDTIIAQINDSTEQEIASFKIPEHMKAIVKGGDAQENLIKMCLKMFQIYLKDERGSQLRRMLTFEQTKNTDAGKFFTDKIIDAGLEYITNIFSELVKQRYYLEADPYVMAMQFYAPLYLLLIKYDRQPEKYEEAELYLEKHILQFDKIYLKRSENK